MPSPFPGMDPYLESHWGDVHTSMVTYARDQLQPTLPESLVARVEERMVVETAAARRKPLVPDVRIVELRPDKGNGAVATLAVSVAEPMVLEVDEPATQGFIEIRDRRSGNRVVTVVEVLSLSNKVPGPGHGAYVQKRRELHDGDVSLVEIDLLRAGQFMLPIPLDSLPPSHRTPYQVCVRRGWRGQEVEVYAVPLRERLPIIKVPLRQDETDAVLDLQALIDLCYRNGRHEDDLDYQEDADPPLTGGDARWAAALLRKLGLRKPSQRPRRNGA